MWVGFGLEVHAAYGVEQIQPTCGGADATKLDKIHQNERPLERDGASYKTKHPTN